MKKALLALFLVIIFLPVDSQILGITGSHSTVINNGDTIFVDSLSIVTEMVAYANVTNNDTASHNIFCRKRPGYLVPNSINTFCWAGTCYPPAILVSTSSQFIGAGQTNSEFSAHYEPGGYSGISVIKYIFTILHNDTDSAWFYVKFNGMTGINDNNILYAISAPYPNPSNSFTNINYNFPVGSKAIVQVMNICGKIEKQYSLTESMGTLQMNVSDLYSGIYFCALTINDKVVKTSKLIISH